MILTMSMQHRRKGHETLEADNKTIISEQF
jgi:hypothetical protein